MQCCFAILFGKTEKKKKDCVESVYILILRPKKKAVLK